MVNKSRATHITVKGNKKRVVQRERDETGTVFIVRNMTGKVMGTYNKKDMNKFNKKYVSLSLQNKDKRARDLD